MANELVASVPKNQKIPLGGGNAWLAIGKSFRQRFWQDSNDESVGVRRRRGNEEGRRRNRRTEAKGIIVVSSWDNNILPCIIIFYFLNKTIYNRHR